MTAFTSLHNAYYQTLVSHYHCETCASRLQRVMIFEGGGCKGGGRLPQSNPLKEFFKISRVCMSIDELVCELRRVLADVDADDTDRRLIPGLLRDLGVGDDDT